MKNFITSGERIIVTAPEGGLTAGAPVVVGSKVGIVLSGGAANEKVAVCTEGVFEMPKAAGAISQGDKLYLDESEGNFTKTAAGNVYAGYAFEAAEADDELVQITLVDNPGDVQTVPKATTVATLGATTNLTAIAAEFADLAAARTAVNTLATEVEARLDAVEAKIDAVIAALKAANLMA